MGRPRTTAAFTTWVLVAFVAGACHAGARPANPSDGEVHVVASGLRIPWDVAFLPDGTALVTERGNDLPDGRDRRDPASPPRPTRGPMDRGAARILSVTPDGRVSEVQRLPQNRTPGDGGVRVWRGEGGLLGITVSPHYTEDRWVYAYYTTDTDNRIARFHLGGTLEPILTGIPAGDFHNGGRLAFGPDGMLYATTGETHETRDIAQDPHVLGGKVLRITPDGEPAPGNPFGNEVWSLGHRNVQGMAWDSRGRMFASEFGGDRFDEINLIERGGNYGWPAIEGVGGAPRYRDPLIAWPPSEASPSGIAIVGDHIYVACLRGQRLYRLGLDGHNAEQLLVGRYGRLRTVTAATDGSLWLTTSNQDGMATIVSPHAVVQPDDDRILRFRP